MAPPRRPCHATVALLALLAGSSLSAQRPPVRTWTTADGLPRDQLQCVRSDSTGFVWFCTAEGLVRFDGHVAVTFGRSEGLEPAGVRSFLKASGGRYFVGGESGLFRFDAAADDPRRRFAPVPCDDGRSALGVNAMVEARDHGIWFGTGRGLLHLAADGSGAPGEVDIGLPRQVENDLIVRAVAEDERGALWVGAESGLYVRWANGNVTRITAANGLPADGVLAVAFDSERRPWAATRQGLALLDRDAIESRRSRLVARVFTVRDGLPSSNVRALLAEGSALWVATTLGVAETRVTDEGDLAVGQTLTGFYAWDLTTDLRGDLWVATEAGARRLARRGFTTFSTEEGLPDRRALSLLETTRGEVCATTAAHGLEISCLRDGRFEAVSVGAVGALHDPGWGWSQTTLQDRGGGWWLPTGEGLYRFPPGPVSALATARPQSIMTRRDGLRSDSIFRLFEDSRNGIWLSTFAEGGNGLARVEASSGTLRTFGPADGLSEDFPLAFSLTEDRSGRIWIGFHEGRLMRYRDRFEEIPLHPPTETRTARMNDNVSAILADRHGRIWLASTLQGLGRIEDPAAAVPAVRWYGKAEGLSSETAWSIVEGLSGELFVATGRGIDRFDPATERFTHYSADEGVPRGEIAGGLRDRQGGIWFATSDGVTRFTSLGTARDVAPVTLVTAVRVAGAPLPIRADGARQLGGVVVGPGDRRVEIDFVSPGARAADGVRYQHRLEGLDEDWSITEARSVALAGAAPGRYRFLVRALFADGRSTEPASVGFVVLAPVWRRGWFLSLAALSLAGLALAFHRSRVKRAVAVERVRSQIAADLHDSVGANLSRIAILSEVVKRQAVASLPEAVKALTAIGQNAREVIDDMSDAVWFIDPRLDSLQSVAVRVRTLASELFSEHEIGVTIETPADAQRIALSPEQRRHLYLILKESLTNVHRHARATRVVVRITTTSGRLCVEVVDDGVGLPAEEAASGAESRGGHGLENLRHRAAALGGTVTIASDRRGSGTRVVVEAPLGGPHRHAVGRIPTHS